MHEKPSCKDRDQCYFHERTFISLTRGPTNPGHGVSMNNVPMRPPYSLVQPTTKDVSVNRILNYSGISYLPWPRVPGRDQRPGTDTGHDTYDTMPFESRNEECGAPSENAASGHNRVRCGRPVNHPGKSVQLRIVPECKKAPPSRGEGAGDVYREIRVRDPRRETYWQQFGGLRLGRGISHRHCCRHLQHGQ